MTIIVEYIHAVMDDNGKQIGHQMVQRTLDTSDLKEGQDIILRFYTRQEVMFSRPVEYHTIKYDREPVFGPGGF